MVGKKILHYNILKKLGEGGMGIVYLTEDTKLKREVAIKFLPRSIATNTEDRERFKIEAQAAAALNHPNISHIYAIEETDDEIFIVMEYIDGEELKEKISKGTVTIDQTIKIATQMAEGLQEAHSKGIVHRDIKSSNIMITDKGQIKIMDFGLAKIRGGLQLTKEHSTLGTAPYMSPEQARGDEVDHRSDIWSFGIVIYEMVSGQLPFKGDYEQAVIYSILNEPPEPLETETELQQGISRLIDKCLEKEQKNRFANMGEVISELENIEGRKHTLLDDKTLPLMRSFLELENKELEHEKSVFVGRKNELQKLDDRLTTALSGQFQVTFITGEAGSGKTALVAEFTQLAQERCSELIVSTGKCRDHTGILDPFLPFREMLGQLTGDIETQFAAGGITREHAVRLWNLIPISVTALLDSGGFLIENFISGASLQKRTETAVQRDMGWVISLQKLIDERKSATTQAPINKNEILRQYTEVLKIIAKQHPLLLILEDLHWADIDSIHLLFNLIKGLTGCEVLIVGTFRSSEVARGREQDRHPLESIINDLKQLVKELEIEVGKTDRREFIDVLLDSVPNRLDQNFRDTLFRQTKGHPLFTIQLLQDMQEQEILLKDEKGLLHEGQSLYWEQLPARVDAVIGERIDRLPEKLRKVLNVACVEGEDFSAEVLAKILKFDEREIVRILSSELDKKHHLISALNIKRVNGQRLSQYRFRHILFQIYLYGHLDNIEKSYLHEDVGTVLEELHGTQSNQIAAQLARHFEEAEIDQKAVRYLLQAGNNTMKLSANEQAITHFIKGLALLEKLPESEARTQLELDLQMALGIALQPLKGFSSEEVALVYERALELCRQKEQPDRFFKVLWGIWVVRVTRAEFKVSHQINEQLLEIAKKEQESELMLQALHAAWTTDFYSGNFRQAQNYCQQGLALYEPEKHIECTYEYGNHDPGMCGNGILSYSLLLQGYADQAKRQLQNSISLSKKVEHSFSQAYGIQTIAVFRYFQRDRESAHIAGKELLTFCEKHNNPIFIALGKCIHGWSSVLQKETQEGFTELNEGMDILREIDAGIFQPFCSVFFAEACIENENIELARKTLDDSLQMIHDSGGYFYMAEHYRLKGKLAYLNLTIKKENTNKTFHIEAEQNYLKAIEISKKQNAKLLELRASVDLGKLWQETGKKAEALKMLKQVYDWFDEGFDLLDLLEAKELLTEL